MEMARLGCCPGELTGSSGGEEPHTQTAACGQRSVRNARFWWQGHRTGRLRDAERRQAVPDSKMNVFPPQTISDLRDVYLVVEQLAHLVTSKVPSVDKGGSEDTSRVQRGRREQRDALGPALGPLPPPSPSLLPPQFQSFSQYRCKTAKKSEEEIDFLRSNPKIWNVHSVLNVLHSLVDKSNINRQLEVYTSGGECCLPCVPGAEAAWSAEGSPPPGSGCGSPRCWGVSGGRLPESGADGCPPRSCR